MFKNIPTDSYFLGNESILRIKIYEQMTNLLQEVAEAKGEEFDQN